MIRTYRELSRLDTFDQRYEYLKLDGHVGHETFGFDRYLNQAFYTSREWRQVRQHVIARDLGCDLGVEGYEIHDRLVIHHINPITPEDIIEGRELLVDPENLITTTHDTHNAIHYGDRSLLQQPYVERRPGDTKLW